MRCSPLESLFAPDLIVEVTSVCDRACPGCYSPTLRTSNDIVQTHTDHPELFLSATTLERVLEPLGPIPMGIALRGGEPSRHPELADLVRTSRAYSHHVWVETHGRWLLDLDAHGQIWLDVFRETDTVAKISFDRMHALRRQHLETLCERLDSRGVRWMVAITEPTPEEFDTARDQCAWIPDGKVVFQEKVTDHRLLVHPRLGTLTVDGLLRAQPTYKESLQVLAS